MRLSFVIPAHNEELLIGRTVAACAAAGRASGDTFEIVVACDACTDRTAEIARAGGARAVDVNKRIIAGARNAGAAAATGELLFFVDADTAPPSESIREAIELVRCGAIGGGGPFVFDGELPRSVRWSQGVMNFIGRVCRLTGGCFLFCTRGAFDAVGGWDETLLVSEEITLARALKRKGRFALVRTPVLTSGRKLRTYSAWELLGIVVRGMLVPSMRRDRKRLGLWYGERREDPGAVEGRGAGSAGKLGA